MSSEVGSAHISIFPVMTGFKTRVSKETKEAGAAGAKTFEGGFKGAGTSTGRSLGRDLKSSLASSAGDLGAAQTRKLTGEIASASAALARVRLKQQDDAGRVRVAETRLAEAIAKSGAGSSQAVAAEERLASTRRTLASTTEGVASATNRLKTAQTALADASKVPAGPSFMDRLKSSATGAAGAVSSGFSSIVGAARRAGAAAGDAIGAGIKAGSTTAITVVAAGIGVAFGKGIGRLNAIDTARAKLTGLGNDAESVTAIMGNALSSVKGTSFGLGEAATVAAGAVAAGIRPGEQLEGTLKGIANVAAASGASMEETGAIFNKVASTGRAYTENLNQLADRGIPIYQALATQLGVTTDEVRSMATEGKIDFQTFSTAAAAAAGTVASEMGKTVPGAARNFFAAMGRIGANALQPVYGKIAPLILAATSALGPIEERAKQFGDLLLRVVGPAMDWITGLLTRIGEGASLADLGLGGLTGVLGPLAGILAAVGAGGLGGLLSRIPMLTSLLPGLTGALGFLGGPLGIIAAAFAGFALSGADTAALVGSLTGVIDQVVAAIPGLVSQVATLVPQLVNSILAQVPSLITVGLNIIMALTQGLVTAIPAIADGALALVTGLVSAIVANLPVIISGAINLVQALIFGIVQALPLLVSGAVSLVSGLLTAIVDALPMIIEGGVQLLMAVVSGILTALPVLLQAVIDLVAGLTTALIDNLPMIIDAGIQLLLALVTGIINALPQLITTAIKLILQLVTNLLQQLPRLIELGIQLVVSLIVGLVQAIPQIIRMLPQIVSAIWDGLTKVNWLDLGVQIVMGIINGLKSMVGAVVNAIKNVASAAFEGFKDFFGIASPAKRMIQPGRDVVRGAVAGVEDESDSFGDELVAMANDATARAQRSMATVAATVSATAVGTTGHGAPPATTGMPSTLVVVDADGELIGRMRVEADASVKEKADKSSVRLGGGSVSS